MFHSSATPVAKQRTAVSPESFAKSPSQAGPLQTAADGSAPVMHLQALQLMADTGVVQRKDSYSYGSANTVPHIHCYRSGCHLKIVDPNRDSRSPIRYNIVQNGKKHPQSVYALEAAKGNDALVAAINAELEGY